MSAWAEWPACAGADPVLPERLDVERGIWGKAQGASTDYRWLARSPGMPSDAKIAASVVMGAEDVPVSAQLWRPLVGGATCAVGCYPSQARDAFGRPGLIEKQILLWGRPGALPAVLGALLLLPRVAALDHGDWWHMRRDRRWKEPAFCLPLDRLFVPVDSGSIDDLLSTGLQALKDATTEEALSAFYARVLDRRRPAFFEGIKRPLRPEALAALLLPLQRPLADCLAVAGWMLDEDYAPRDRENAWDIVVGTARARVAPPSSHAVHLEAAKACARAIIRGVPPERSRSSAPVALAAPSAASPSATTAPPFPSREELAQTMPAYIRAGRLPDDIVAALRVSAPQRADRLCDLVHAGIPRELLEPELQGERRELRIALFALSGETWLDPETFARDLRQPLRVLDDDPLRLLFPAIVARLEADASRIPHRAVTLRTKAAALRAAAIALCPGSLGADMLSGISVREVAPLLFAPQLVSDEWPRLVDMGRNELQSAIRLSLRCPSRLDRNRVWGWLHQWLQDANDEDRRTLQALVDEAQAPRGAAPAGESAAPVASGPAALAAPALERHSVRPVPSRKGRP